MTHGSFFSGIGGFDIAAHWCGWHNVFQCEKDTFCQRVLRHHFPKTELYDDIKKTNFTKFKGAIDIISGGFPCQPFSCAGKRKGMADDRFIWNEMLRGIHEIQPTWVVAENVYGLVSHDGGMVFERVCVDLENEGYEVQSYIIPACAVGAPHKRNRVWIIANSGKNGSIRRCSNCNIKESKKEEWAKYYSEITGFSKKQSATDTDSSGSKKSINKRKTGEFTQEIPNFRFFPTQSPLCSRDDGLSLELVGITLSGWRRKSIESLGNAIVPQIAFQIFRIIEHVDKQQRTKH